MSKRAEKAALKAYPYKIEEHPKVMGGSITFDANSQPRTFFKEGYEQAEKDIITQIREQVERWMTDNPEGDEHIAGERVAFRSVLHLLKELEDEK